MLKAETPRRDSVKEKRQSLGRNPLEQIGNPQVLGQIADALATLLYFRPRTENEKLPEPILFDITKEDMSKEGERNVLGDISNEEVEGLFREDDIKIAPDRCYEQTKEQVHLAKPVSSEERRYEQIPIEEIVCEGSEKMQALEERVTQLTNENKRLVADKENALAHAEFSSSMVEDLNNTLAGVLKQRTQLENEIALKSRKMMAKQGRFALLTLERAYIQRKKDLEEKAKRAEREAADGRVMDMLKTAIEAAYRKIKQDNTENIKTKEKISQLEHVASAISERYQRTKRRLGYVYKHYNEKIEEIRTLGIIHKEKIQGLKKKAYTIGALAGAAAFATIAGLYSSNTTIKAENDSLRRELAAKNTLEMKITQKPDIKDYNRIDAQKELHYKGIADDGKTIILSLKGKNSSILKNAGYSLEGGVMIGGKFYKATMKEGIAKIDVSKAGHAITHSDVKQIYAKNKNTREIFASQTGDRIEYEGKTLENIQKNIDELIHPTPDITPPPSIEKEKKQEKQTSKVYHAKTRQDYNLKHANRQYAQRNRAMIAYLR